ncbi:cytochrome c [Diaphorobacter sp. HDW4B]|uniref:c-type cytochrome n=1 Tax=Diaphorobacter sp. HDW4B TaxID=2714925 RepID=UPI001407B185|nr:cytochrome c [Diaphorobacter sp. HDW4B]QIL70003.1 cytochrome c [Diaphorobacter sp. HDW4B]
MNDLTNNAVWLEWLLEGMHRAQWGLLRAMHVVGLVGEVDEQAAWPWRWRLAGENLLIDQAQARQLAISLLIIASVLVLLVVALWWKRARLWLVGASALALVLAPWPAAAVLFTQAHPTSFHVAAVPFSDHAIANGARLYAAQCVQCHGENGKGQGALASQQPVWPPNFASPLLWRRADGELLWAVRHGLQGRDGQQTMPAFAQSLNVQESWELLQYLRALAAGELLRATGNWPQPVHLPDMQLRCHNASKQWLSDWKNQRVLLVTADPQKLLPDPRMVTVWLPTQVSNTVPDTVDCAVTSVADARASISLINGSADVEQSQWLTDRQGWLRARNGRGIAAWNDDDLLCKSPTADQPVAALAVTPEDQLTRIIRTMDAEPVRFVKGGRVH